MNATREKNRGQDAKAAAPAKVQAGTIPGENADSMKDPLQRVTPMTGGTSPNGATASCRRFRRANAPLPARPLGFA
jgi:hypothetical protein